MVGLRSWAKAKALNEIDIRSRTRKFFIGIRTIQNAFIIANRISNLSLICVKLFLIKTNYDEF